MEAVMDRKKKDSEPEPQGAYNLSVVPPELAERYAALAKKKRWTTRKTMLLALQFAIDHAEGKEASFPD